MKSTQIRSLIYSNYLKSSLIPILVIEVALLLLFFGTNHYISGQNRRTLLGEATNNIEDIASLEVAVINHQLTEVRNLSLMMQRDHQAFFDYQEPLFLPTGEPQFAVHENGAFYKVTDNGGSSLYYANTTRIGESERQKARRSELLDPLLRSIVDTSPIITQAYLNTWDDMNRLYPFMQDAPSQYGPAIRMEDYNFYYDADAAHNPERLPVWTGAYLDPAGQGWMVSLIVPIYHGDFLEGVSGLDVTIDSFVQNVLALHFPWDAGVFMVDSSGTILAMQSKVESILGLKELGTHDYSENIKETIEKPDQFNLLNNPDPALQSRFQQLFESGERMGSIVIDRVDYIISQEIVNETGWRMITLIEKANVFAPITKLETLGNRLGLAAVFLMILFYTAFFAYLITQSRNLSSAIAAPISKLADLTKDLGKRLKSEPLSLSGITEVDTLTENFNTMTQKLNLAIHESLTARQEADSVISNFLDSLLVVDQQLRITRINKETCHLLGIQKEEVLSKPVFLLFDEPESVIASYFSFPYQPENANRTELRNLELTFVGKEGNKLPVSINLARVNNEAGETVGVVAGAKDISELKQAISRAKRQQQFIQDILDTIPGGILVLDHLSHLTQRNDTYNRLVEKWSVQYGIGTEDLTAQVICALTHNLPVILSGEIQIKGTDDTLIVEYYASSGVQEQSHSRVIFLHDVTLRHKADAIRKLQSAVMQQTTEGIVITDTDGIILNCNLAAQTMSGYDSASMIGQKTSIFKSGNQNSAFYYDLWESIKKGEVWTGSMMDRSRNGKLFEIEMTISPVRSTGNEITHYVSLWRDVSQVRYLQQQLLHAQKLEAIGQLAAGVAHEINTPIQYIMSNLDFFKTSFEALIPLLDAIQKGLQDKQLFGEAEWQQCITKLVEEAGLDFLLEEIPGGIEDALGGAHHVARIVNALKEFSHPGKGEKDATDLNRLIKNALTVAQNELKHIAELETSFDPDLPVLNCDPGSISQVMLNLIVNAADAIREKNGSDGLGKIHVSTRKIENSIELRISDSGVGIPEDIRDRIFDPFFTTKEVGKGTGQGLAIAYDIVVNKHKGSIRCEGKVGVGTTMILKFPLETPMTTEG